MAIMRENPRRARPQSRKKTPLVADFDEVVFISERLVGIYAAQCAQGTWEKKALFLWVFQAIKPSTIWRRHRPVISLRHVWCNLGAWNAQSKGAMQWGLWWCRGRWSKCQKAYIYTTKILPYIAMIHIDWHHKCTIWYNLLIHETCLPEEVTNIDITDRAAESPGDYCPTTPLEDCRGSIPNESTT